MEEIEFSSRSMMISYEISDLDVLLTKGKCLFLYQNSTSKFKDLVSLIPTNKLILMEIENGELCKSLDTAEKVMEILTREQFSRSDSILALGGGSLTDLAGFVASVFKRGIRCIFVPTTLLSMVDASIGGKNSLDFAGLKNIIGTFYHPDAVVIRTDFLSSLPDDQYLSGLGEVLKYAISIDYVLYQYLLDNRSKVLKRDPETMRYILDRCISIKIGVVKSDEFETKGIRELLNFGHTIGHAIEARSVFTVSHGVAVAAGMLVECNITEQLGITKPGTLSRLEDLLKQFIPSALEIHLDNEILDFIKNDKKVRSCKIKMPILEEIGKSKIYEIQLSQFEEAFNEVQIWANWK